jgi:FixJ family two-component response regulator
VFVVDDDTSVRESLQRLIESEDWHPETFCSGRHRRNCHRMPASTPMCVR